MQTTQELTKKECDELTYMNNIISKRYQDLVEFRNQINMLNIAFNTKTSELIKKYELDPNKNYTFDGSNLVEKEEK